MILTQVKIIKASSFEILEDRVNKFLKENTTMENGLKVESFQYVYDIDTYFGSLTYTIKTENNWK